MASYFSCQSFNSPPIHPLGELFLCHPSLKRVIFVLSIPCPSYFRAYYLILHPLASYFCVVHSLGELFSCQPFNSPSFWRVILVPSIPWASYFRAYHLILHPLASYFSCQSFNSPPIHPLCELFLCHPSLRRVIFVLSIPCASYFRAYYLILHPLASYFRADHLTLHPSILLASYFCAVYHLGELFLHCPTLGRVIFVHTI